VERGLLKSGAIKKMIDSGEVLGITSNPTIFEKAISGSDAYDDAIAALVRKNKDIDIAEIYETLALEDIGAAADLLLPVYEKTNGVDGYISIEVAPDLAYATAETVSEGKRLFSALGRPNVMIKVPATTEGFPAITELIAEGINVNATLMFSIKDYVSVAKAYLKGLAERSEDGGDLGTVASVASFFISRIDTAVDAELDAASPLRGKAGIASGKLAYEKFHKLFTSEKFTALKEKGARVQRVLWASTSVKDPAYPDVLYMDSLIGPDTINTAPPSALDAFRDHGTAAATLTEGLEDARTHLAELERAGVDFALVTEVLKKEGVTKFKNSFDSLMDTLTAKRDAVLAEST